MLKMTREERHTQRRLWGKRLHGELHGRPNGPDCSRKVKTIVKSRERRTPPARFGGGFKLAAALSAAAMLTTASAAFGAADPLAGGSTTLGPLKLPGKVKLSAKGGATKSGKTVTLPITGGQLDATNGSGPVQDGGKIQLKKGKNKASLKSIVTTFGAGGGISAKLNGKKAKLATISGGTVSRAGFGGKVTDAVAKLTKKGAKALNKALGITRGGFKAGKLGKISTTTVPSTVTLTGGSVVDTGGPAFGHLVITGATNAQYGRGVGLGAPFGDGVTVSNGATSPAPGAPITFPVSGGNVAPDGKKGTVNTQGTLHVEKTYASNAAPFSFPGTCEAGGGMVAGQSIVGNFQQIDNPQNDLTNGFVNANVTLRSPGAGFASATSLGVTAAANLDMSSATVTSDPAAKTVTISGAKAVFGALQAQVVTGVFGSFQAGCGPAPDPAAGDVFATIVMNLTTQ
jgi:hypothetical protein